jgi:hypothetical protein
MTKKLKNLLLKISVGLYLFFVSLPVRAQLLNPDGSKQVADNMKSTGQAATFNTSGDKNNLLLSTTAGTIVTAFLSVLGIIFLVMVLIGGFNWMTAAGSDDKVSKAKATLIRGVIGLIIVVAAYVITAFVFRAVGGMIRPGY